MFQHVSTCFNMFHGGNTGIQRDIGMQLFGAWVAVVDDVRWEEFVLNQS